MNETAMRQFLKSSRIMMNSRVTLKWRYGHTGTYDTARGEYEDGAGNYIEKEKVPCIIYQLTPGRLMYGNWGNAQQGDLIVAVAEDIDIDGMEDVRAIINGAEYLLVPNSTIPYDQIGGVIGTIPIARALHCRFVGART